MIRLLIALLWFRGTMTGRADQDSTLFTAAQLEELVTVVLQRPADPPEPPNLDENGIPVLSKEYRQYYAVREGLHKYLSAEKTDSDQTKLLVVLRLYLRLSPEVEAYDRATQRSVAEYEMYRVQWFVHQSPWREIIEARRCAVSRISTWGEDLSKIEDLELRRYCEAKIAEKKRDFRMQVWWGRLRDLHSQFELIFALYAKNLYEKQPQGRAALRRHLAAFGIDPRVPDRMLTNVWRRMESLKF